MQIVNVTNGDTGHQSYLLSQAINDHTEHVSCSFVRHTSFGWAYDVMWQNDWDRTPQWIVNYWAEADIVHLHNYWKKSKYWAKAPKATWIVHQHGRCRNREMYREHLKTDERLGAVRVVSTINLLPDVDWDLSRWFPRPVTPILPVKTLWNDPLRIVQSPTRRYAKQTDLFEEIAKELREKYGIVYEIIEGKSHQECMLRKARADILFDQLTPSYGTSALEAWGLGIPAIVGVTPEIDDFVIENIVKEPPYVLATNAEELYEALERLILDDKYRAEFARRGNEYVRKWHSPEVCAEIAIRAYQKALNR